VQAVDTETVLVWLNPFTPPAQPVLLVCWTANCEATPWPRLTDRFEMVLPPDVVVPAAPGPNNGVVYAVLVR
jgi:hypothetical protein